jgi:hypothetical protein
MMIERTPLRQASRRRRTSLANRFSPIERSRRVAIKTPHASRETFMALAIAGTINRTPKPDN